MSEAGSGQSGGALRAGWARPTGWTGANYSAARVALALAGMHVGAAHAGAGGASPLALFAIAATLLSGTGFALGLLPVWTGMALFAADLWILWGAGTPPSPALVALLWMLLLWASAPPDPWGSWQRRGEPDPGTDWQMAPWIAPLGWTGSAAAIGFALGGLASLPVAGAFAGATAGAMAAVTPPLRHSVWVGLGIAIAVALFGGAGGLPGALLLLPWLCLAEPAWLPPRPAGTVDEVFYDGGCALCHGTIRCLIAEDPRAERFRFAPLSGETIANRLDPQRIAALPDAVVILRADGELLVESSAMLHAALRLGGLWRVLGEVGLRVPERLRDIAYRLVARSRYRVFGTRSQACPLLPPHLRERISP